VRDGSKTNGYVSLVPGDITTRTGFIEFMNAGDTWSRMAYIGYGDATNFQFRVENDRNLVFSTTNIERMTITGGGNVGIGTTTPTQSLDVRGNIAIGGSSSSNYITFLGTTGDGPGEYNHTFIGERVYNNVEESELLIFKGNDGTDRVRLVGGEIRFDTFDNPVWGSFESVAKNANVKNRMTITGAGNVGIGTTAPSAKLEVAGNVKISGSGDKILEIVSSSDSRTRYFAGSNQFAVGTHTNAFIWNFADTHIEFGTNGTDRMRILNNGNVGIGTTTPTEKLEVAGNIKMSGDLNMNSVGRINNLVEPSAAQDAATKNYVDNLGPSVTRDDTAGNYHSLALIPVGYISNTDGYSTRANLRVARGGTYGGPTYVPSTNTLASENIASAYINGTTVQANTLTVHSNVQASTTYLYLTNPGHLGDYARNTSSTPYVSTQITLGSLTFGPWIRTVMDPKVLTDAYRFEICNYNYYPPTGGSRITPVLTIPQGGHDPRVGINTTVPTATLDVRGSIRSSYIACATTTIDPSNNHILNKGYVTLVPGDIRTGFIEFKRFINGQDTREAYIGDGDANNFYFNVEKERNLLFSTSGQYRMTILNNGRVGIGTTSPRCAFEVVGTTTTTGSLTTYGGYISSSDNAENGIGESWADSIVNPLLLYDTVGYATQRSRTVVAAFSGGWVSCNNTGGFIIESDQRIKSDIVSLNTNTCLELYRKLRVVKHSYIDKITNGNIIKYGFIAQEVQKLLPDAVIPKTDIIPSIYKTSTIVDKKTLHFHIPITDIQQFNIGTKLKCYDVKNEIVWVTIKEIIDSQNIEIEETITNDKLFVYGHSVDDFLQIDYDPIRNLTTAALQEVDRQQQADKARIAELEATVAAQQLLINDILERLKKVGA
jgi:hypothetical protein